MVEHFDKWNFEVIWKGNCDAIVVDIPGREYEVDIEELYFDSRTDAERCLREQDVFLLSYDEKGEEYPCEPAIAEYNEETGYYELYDNPRSRAILELYLSSLTFF